MKSAVVVFPASNCDRDAAVALEQISGEKPHMAWHGDTDLPDVDLIVLPGGFAYGDYLRCGAMAAQSRIMRDVKKKADEGVAILGICNGFQVLTETGLLPGALMRNASSNSSAAPSASKSRKRNRSSRANTTRASGFRFPSPMATAIISRTTKRWTGWKARAAWRSATRRARTRTARRAISRAF